MRALSCILLLLLALPTLVAQTPYPIPGSDFVANTTLPEWRSWFPETVIDEEGRFVVGWLDYNSHGNDDDETSVQGRRFARGGRPVGLEFQINTYSTGWQSGPKLAVLPNRQFVVVWSSAGSYSSDTDGSSVQAQFLDEEGFALGGQFQVNELTEGSQSSPDVSSSPDGFIVVWHSENSAGSDSDGWSIQAQRFDGSGNRQGNEFQVNSYTTNYQISPQVDAASDGRFVVAWVSEGSYGTTTDDYSIQAQRFEPSGLLVGQQFQVNESTEIGWRFSVAVAAEGSLMASWTDWSDVGIGLLRAVARVYEPTGTPLGPEFPLQVTTHPRDRSQAVRVTSGPEGDFVVSWDYSFLVGDYPGGSFYTKTQWKGQRYDVTGATRGDEFVIASIGGFLDYRNFCDRSIDANSRGEFVVVWNSPSEYCSISWRVMGKRFQIPVGEIFPDGFESGDTSAWSSAQ